MKLVGNVIWVSKVLTLIIKIYFGDSDSLVFKETIDLIPFHVFLKLLMLFLK